MKTKRTKLVCTIGPASNTKETIRKMIKNGMNVARLNFSHGTHETHRETINLLREVSAELGVHIGILQDLCGPKIRLGTLPPEGILLERKKEVVLASSDAGIEDAIPVDYSNIENEVKPGEHILIADGALDLVVKSISGKRITCDVITGGMIFSRKGANMPQSKLQVAAFTEKDRADVRMGLEAGVDFVALSFVRSAEDLSELIQEMGDYKGQVKLIAKIEKPQAVANLDEILDVVDGVMVARGDLGVEMPLEQIPHVQKQIITAARLSGKLVITATQMLASMVSCPRPTRGETTDVANAVLDGTDALMLSDETANGQFPVEAVETLARTAAAAEPFLVSSLNLDNEKLDDSQAFTWAIGRAASWLVQDIKASLIVCFTTSGYVASCISRFRPNCNILALTPSETTCRTMSMIWGAKTLQTEEVFDTESVINTAKQKAIESGLAQQGDNIIVTAGLPFGMTKTTSFLRIVTID